MLKRNKIKYIIALMSLALLGLVALQFYWIDNALYVQEEYFNQNINRAMNEVMNKLEKQEAANFISKKMNLLGVKASGSGTSGSHEIRITGQGGAGLNGTLEIETDSVVEDNGQQSKSYKKITIDNVNGHTKTKHLVIKDGVELRNSEDTGNASGDNAMRVLFEKGGDINANLNVFQNLMVDISIGNSDVISKIKPKELDSLIKSELQNQGVETKFAFGIYNMDVDQMMLANSKDYETELLNSPYKMRMFASGLFPKPDFLTLYFPSKNNFLFHKMGLVLGSSITLLLLIVFCFGYTIVTIMRQKKLSQMKTDFINNMTHEFKTPVSTILLASEALKDPSVIENTERLNRLVNVIHDENNRIGSHVERVLQLAAMEKGNFKLNPAKTNVEELIERVIQGISIQAESKNGRIVSNFTANLNVCNIDELHFSNVIYNLLDNAIKYCTIAPNIIVTTANEGNRMLVTVADNGIGLTKEQQSKIFEQFYRVPTGNLHDVKGFGLGLHYVKTILEMHGGSINVKSEKGKGSTFEIEIPTCN